MDFTWILQLQCIRRSDSDNWCFDNLTFCLGITGDSLRFPIFFGMIVPENDAKVQFLIDFMRVRMLCRIYRFMDYEIVELESVILYVFNLIKLL